MGLTIPGGDRPRDQLEKYEPLEMIDELLIPVADNREEFSSAVVTRESV